MMKMKGGKAKDDAGIVAEMIKHGGEQLRSVILAVFNDLLADNALIPQSWKQTRLLAIFKKGDP